MVSLGLGVAMGWLLLQYRQVKSSHMRAWYRYLAGYMYVNTRVACYTYTGTSTPCTVYVCTRTHKYEYTTYIDTLQYYVYTYIYDILQ